MRDNRSVNVPDPKKDARFKESLASVLIETNVVAPSGELKRYEIDYRQLDELKPIGKGSFGVVFS